MADGGNLSSTTGTTAIRPISLGIENAWVIIWITEDSEPDDFMAKYGEYVKDCKIIRR